MFLPNRIKIYGELMLARTRRERVNRRKARFGKYFMVVGTGVLVLVAFYYPNKVGAAKIVYHVVDYFYEGQSVPKRELI